ncbi:MAG: adenine nucleotide alpha hydrolase [Pseudomonadota bacterium]|nr:adenine nucleotide alpha hydrolase [Pseudomonadota bacterium]
MIDRRTAQQIRDLERLLARLAPVTIAVSGGVDSMTLAIAAGRTLGPQAVMFHALSPAVPPAATARVKETARAERWNLHLVNAGEFRDEDYLKNPYRRCFHCKKNLYATLAVDHPGTILSGTNLDDMDDFRPGLRAAEQFAVRHPFVECGIDKAGIRRICRALRYGELADLPASPCLSSRVETGLRIEPRVLDFIDRVESGLRDFLRPEAVRCRVRRDEIAVQLDAGSLTALSSLGKEDWAERIGALAQPLGLPVNVRFEPYRMGSAFVRNA